HQTDSPCGCTISMNSECPFCKISEERIAFTQPSCVALWDGFPVAEGHLLLVPQRHVPTWGELTDSERSGLVDTIATAKACLLERFSLNGFNVGFNEGVAAGQTVPHFHIHVIPRRLGDVADPRGGVRH